MGTQFPFPFILLLIHILIQQRLRSPKSKSRSLAHTTAIRCRLLRFQNDSDRWSGDCSWVCKDCSG